MTLLLWHATRIALGLNEWPASWSPGLATLLSHLFGHDEATRVLERVFVWAHVLTILAFLAYLPRSKHLHIATAAVNVWFGRTRARRAARAAALRADEARPRRSSGSAPGTAADLTWKQVLDTFSCTECGRCQDVCPAFATGKALSPKLLIMGLRDQVLAHDGGGRWSPAPSPTSRCGTASPAARACRRARCRSSTSTTSSTCAATW